MENYRSLQLGSRYTENDINVGFHVLNTAGIHTRINGSDIVLDFDVVDTQIFQTIGINKRKKSDKTT